MWRPDLIKRMWQQIELAYLCAACTLSMAMLVVFRMVQAGTMHSRSLSLLSWLAMTLNLALVPVNMRRLGRRGFDESGLTELKLGKL